MLKPFKIAGPVRLEIDLAASEYTEKLRACHSEAFSKDGKTFGLDGETVTDVWSQYLVIQDEVKRAK